MEVNLLIILIWIILYVVLPLLFLNAELFKIMKTLYAYFFV
ncbi:hypothetical protein HMPREF0663_11818 [Hoylesella oralis ATCC 33269]|uniref:Uncharacterized protein n=1 Tax=Hoylesella oralis ATCC 33269 TaxID=873533 RepID=E7RRL7_9BACT|nr:hypothetical protein HMPREF0663_11818 [Hoylesella oralis ATCC 33269]